jgi:hypothetical protein
MNRDWLALRGNFMMECDDIEGKCDDKIASQK